MAAKKKQEKGKGKKDAQEEGKTAPETTSPMVVIELDDFTTACKKIPPFYLNDKAWSGGEAPPETEPPTAKSRPPPLDSPLGVPDGVPPLPATQDSARVPTGRRSARGERKIPLIYIQGDSVLMAKDVEKELARNLLLRRKPTQRQEEAVSPGEHEPVTFEVSAADGNEKEVVDEPEAPPPKKPQHSFRPLPEETKKAAERKRQKEIQEQREREKLFAIPLQQSEEIQNHVEINPEPGVQVRRPVEGVAPPPKTNLTRPGQKSRKDEPQIVADGGEYIISGNKQRWTDSSKTSSAQARERKSADEASAAAKKPGMVVAPTGAIKGNRMQMLSSKSAFLEPKKLGSKGEGKMEKSKVEIRRSQPKIMKSARSGFDGGSPGRIVVAQSSHKPQERLPQLPFASPSKYSGDLAKQTKKASVAEQQRLNILTSALTTM